jgi:hypothetical protein
LALVRASLACLIAYITLGKVFQPAILRLAHPSRRDGRAILALLNARKLLPAAFVMVQIEYPFLYGLLYLTLVPAAGALIVRTTWVWRYAAVTLGAGAAQATQGDRLPGALCGAPA